jgi:hypothetical protein
MVYNSSPEQPVLDDFPSGTWTNALETRVQNQRLTYTVKGNPLKWKLNPNPNLPFVEALTQKWRYEVHADVSIDGHWAAHREFRHPALRSWLIGDLWEDTFQTSRKL